MGNIHSVTKSLESLGEEIILIKNFNESKLCKAIILPGVGAFDPAMNNLINTELITDLENWKKSILEFLGEDKVIVESVHKSYLENFKLGPPNRLEQRIIHWQNIYKDFLNASGISF